MQMTVGRLVKNLARMTNPEPEVAPEELSGTQAALLCSAAVPRGDSLVDRLEAQPEGPAAEGLDSVTRPVAGSARGAASEAGTAPESTGAKPEAAGAAAPAADLEAGTVPEAVGSACGAVSKAGTAPESSGAVAQRVGVGGAGGGAGVSEEVWGSVGMEKADLAQLHDGYREVGTLNHDLEI